ncbi:hypothetical protein GCM10010365_24800 [Streptomyces poonensis]|uniref:Uncharacterized protein n=1 Tax=Streptomyces poonensis TaxID=68255 RepID=A0A918PF63_9ACTN|nr:hypothetical protein GCM10010365_24800 [Streptomyces poonensis]GLJ89425.1 hypothetical protein GCM10017589_20250 [Streptomyces poonensis]
MGAGLPGSCHTHPGRLSVIAQLTGRRATPGRPALSQMADAPAVAESAMPRCGRRSPGHRRGRSGEGPADEAPAPAARLRVYL